MNLLPSSSRTRFAELLRAFYLGRITNWEFEDAVEAIAGTKEEEAVVSALFYGGPWNSYSDVPESKFTAGNHPLTAEGKKMVARWILFLKSGQPYDWPLPRPLPGWIVLPLLLSGLPLAWCMESWNYLPVGLLFVFVVAIAHEKFTKEAPSPTDAPEFWPFQNRQSFEEALRFPPYLRGSSAPTTQRFGLPQTPAK